MVEQNEDTSKMFIFVCLFDFKSVLAQSMAETHVTLLLKLTVCYYIMTS